MIIDKSFCSKEKILTYRLFINSDLLAIAKVTLKKVKNETAVLDLIEVDEKYRRCGLGKTLVDYICRDLFSSENRTRLIVTKPTREAIDFYLRLGFIKINNHHYEKQL